MMRDSVKRKIYYEAGSVLSISSICKVGIDEK